MKPRYFGVRFPAIIIVFLTISVSFTVAIPLSIIVRIYLNRTFGYPDGGQLGVNIGELVFSAVVLVPFLVWWIRKFRAMAEI